MYFDYCAFLNAACHTCSFVLHVHMNLRNDVCSPCFIVQNSRNDARKEVCKDATDNLNDRGKDFCKDNMPDNREDLEKG